MIVRSNVRRMYFIFLHHICCVKLSFFSSTCLPGSSSSSDEDLDLINQTSSRRLGKGGFGFILSSKVGIESGSTMAGATSRQCRGGPVKLHLNYRNVLRTHGGTSLTTQTLNTTPLQCCHMLPSVL